MSRHLVVLSDAPLSRVDRGATLARFLGRWRRVEIVTTDALLAGPVRQVDHAFVGLPTAFGPAHAARLRARRLTTFDYFDEPEPNAEAPDAAWLRAQAPLHLKTHRRAGGPAGIGLLPIRYNGAVATAWLRRRIGGWWRRAPRRWDVSLHGSVTYLPTPGGRYEQRVDWLTELRRHPEWRQWGGLVPLPYRTEADLVADHGPEVAALFARGPRIPFREYFARMADTRVALCPTGHARWTYRHVESVYAGCSVVSTDLRGIETLVPAPIEAFRLVADHAPIGPAVAEALAGFDADSDRRAFAVEQMERWLFGGRFVWWRPAPFERFEAQFDG